MIILLNLLSPVPKAYFGVSLIFVLISRSRARLTFKYQRLVEGLGIKNEKASFNGVYSVAKALLFVELEETSCDGSSRGADIEAS